MPDDQESIERRSFGVNFRDIWDRLGWYGLLVVFGLGALAMSGLQHAFPYITVTDEQKDIASVRTDETRDIAEVEKERANDLREAQERRSRDLEMWTQGLGGITSQLAEIKKQGDETHDKVEQLTAPLPMMPEPRRR